jgi:hypothetical protein
MSSQRPRKGKLAIVVTLAALVVTPAAAFTWDRHMTTGWQIFVDCFQDMLFDEAAHRRHCPPGPPVPPVEGPTANQTPTVVVVAMPPSSSSPAPSGSTSSGS